MTELSLTRERRYIPTAEKVRIVEELYSTGLSIAEIANELILFDFLNVGDEAHEREDEPTVEIILCKSKNNLLVEYALRDMTKPLGLAEYKLTEVLPE